MKKMLICVLICIAFVLFNSHYTNGSEIEEPLSTYQSTIFPTLQEEDDPGHLH
jgi:hypothetical protein